MCVFFFFEKSKTFGLRELASRKLSAKAPENRLKKPKRKPDRLPNHPFSGANVLVSGRVLLGNMFRIEPKP